MKKLDKLIIRAFIAPFLATFLISLFVLIMQFFWLYIDDLVGKGLDFITIIKLIVYVGATTVPLALPLSLLLSSIMTFGNLGESFELVAIKSSGIPLSRFMRPLFILSIFIAGVAFLFANNIIPYANLKLNALKYDIIVAKPAFDIKEGVFYDKIEGYAIKIGSKEPNDSIIHNVVIYKKSFGLQDQFLIAESGVMRVTADKRFLQFTLKNGWNYQENGNRYNANTDFIRLGFKEYKKEFDLSSFQMNRTEDSLFLSDPKMLSVRQLNLAVDSLNELNNTFYGRSKRELRNFLKFTAYKNVAWKPVTKAIDKKAKTLSDLIPDSLKNVVIDRVISRVSSVSNSANITAIEYGTRQNTVRKHYIEWNRKFTLSVACIVLFMIGAPLGSIIRKGGLGTPLIFAIIFFVVFHLLNTFGEKFAKEGVTSTFMGMWLSTLLLIPIGIFLTIKAMKDSQLFNQEYYYRTINKVRNKFRRQREVEI